MKYISHCKNYDRKSLSGIKMLFTNCLQYNTVLMFFISYIIAR